MKKLLIIPDCHHPYVDEAAWNAMLRYARQNRPWDWIIQLGDFGDFHACSGHGGEERGRLKVEVEASNRALSQLDALGARRKHMVYGNHENRLHRHVCDKTPEFLGMPFTTVHELFHLEQRGWGWTRYGKMFQLGKAYYAHDPSGAGQNAHWRAGIKCGHPIVHGHTHRAAMVYMGNATGEKRVAIMGGWLGDPERATYYHDLGKEHEWMYSFVVGRMHPGGATRFDIVPIVDGRVLE